MTVWVVTGSRALRKPYTDVEKALVVRVLDAFWQTGDELIQGGCVDVDAWAAKHAKERGMRVTTLLANGRGWTDMEVVEQYSDEVIDTHVGYWARDRREVLRGQKVLAFPMYEEDRSSPQSGTWHTWRVAGLFNKQCALVTIRPRRPVERYGYGVAGPESDKALEVVLEQLTRPTL